MGLEEVLQQLHETGKPVEISWLWDGGVDVNARGEERNFPSVGEALPWLRHWYGMNARASGTDSLQSELQKIYDSEINITIRVDENAIVAGLGGVPDVVEGWW